MDRYPLDFWFCSIAGSVLLILHLLHIWLYAGHFLGGCFFPHLLGCLAPGVEDLGVLEWDLPLVPPTPASTPAPVDA